MACVNNSSWHLALPSRNLSLSCFISGDDYPNKVFPIKIASTDSVYALKKAIKEKNSISLQHVDTSALKLWKVSIPVDHSSEEYVRKLKLRYEETLFPVEELSQVFLDQPEDKHLHIIVRCPPLNSECECFVECAASRLKSVPPYTGGHVAKGREEWATKFPHGAPSQKGELENFVSDQRKAVPAFRFNRPQSADATIPITLYNHIFGQFQDDCKAYRPTKEDHDFALNLSHSMSNVDDSDSETAERARDDFREYGLHFLADEIDGYTTGALRWKEFCLAFFKLCSGGAEPLFEAAWSYVAFTRDKLQAHLDSHLPCFILYATGERTGLLRHVYHILKFISQVLILALQAPFGPIVLICRSLRPPCRSSVMHPTMICECKLHVTWVQQRRPSSH